MEKNTTNLLLDKKTYITNEINANKGLSKGCIASAIVVLIVWICFLTKLFKVSNRIYLYINIVFPLVIIALGLTFFYTKTKMIEKPKFKYFLIGNFIITIFVLNIFLPKHSLLLWACTIIIINHYYNPKIALITFLVVIVLMLIGMYLGMFIGEWDPHFLNGSEDIVINGKPINCEDTTVSERIKWLEQLRANGDNRYLKVFLYYYIPRALEIGLISNISYALSVRSSNLLKLEASEAKKNEKISNELNVAKDIQESVLPKAFDKTLGCNLYGLMDPAKEIGGDFYDYFYIDETHIAFMIADVSGKGVPSALFMMKSEAIIKSLTFTLKQDTAKILERCNKALCANNEHSMFVTCWLGILNLLNGELKYSNAGHNKPLIIKSGRVEFLNDKPGLVLGAFDNAIYTERKLKLEKGDKIFLYTDGVTEANNKNKELFGNDRLFEFVIENKNKPIKEFIYKLRKDVNNFQNGEAQFDDITMLMCEYLKEVTITESKTFLADVKELDNLFEYSSSLLRILNFNNKDIIMINTALEEIFVNVAKYAYDDPNIKGTVEVSLSNDKNKVIFVFKDSGKEFNPLEKADPNIHLSSEEREVGGLGIFMVKKIMDEVRYEYKDGLNVLTLEKNRK